MSPEEADLHELTEALAQLDDHQPGKAMGPSAGVDHAALRAALGGESAAGAPTPEQHDEAIDEETVRPTSPPVLAPVPDPPEGATPALELEFPTPPDPLVSPDDGPPTVGFFARLLFGDATADPEELAQHRVRRNWILFALAVIVVAAVLAGVALRMSEPDRAAEVVAASDEPSTSIAPAGPAAAPRQLTADVSELLTLLGLSPAQIEAVDNSPLIDAGEGDALPDQPRIEQAGAFMLTLDDAGVTSLFGASGTAPCGAHNDLHGAAFHSACTTGVSEPHAGSYFVLWLDTGPSYLAPESASASIRASLDTNADGAVDIPASVVSNGADGVELTDGATGLGTHALVLGSAMAFLVPMDPDTTPQWAFATAATTGQLSDIIDWQRWVIEPEGTRRAAPAVYGTDVRP